MTTPGKNSKLAAVVVTHNRLDQLQKTLTTLVVHPLEQLSTILVFDNASTDGTPDFLATQSDPRLRVSTSAKNLGGAGGFEAALREAAQDQTIDWFVLMDDDARPQGGALAAFHAISRDGCDAWAAAVTYPSGQICDMNRPWINPFRSLPDLMRTLRRGRDGFHITETDLNSGEIRMVDGGSFVGLFLSPAAIGRVGYPDGRMFLYGDDVQYTLSLTQAGGRIGFDPAIRFDHDCETFGGQNSETIDPLWKAYFYCRNLLRVYRQAAGPFLFWGVAAAKVGKWLLNTRHYSGADRRHYLRLLAAAVCDGLFTNRTRSLENVKALIG